jgi:biotin carboxyl carrier protein
VADPAITAVRVGDVVHLDAAGRSVAFMLAPPPDVDRAARAAAAHGGDGGPIDLVAPMPGRVIAVHARAGSVVASGDPVVTLEAMKMEHVVSTPRAGRLAEIVVGAGTQVDRGMRLATVEP